MSEPVRLTIVANELAAETVRALLKTEGIESMQRVTNLSAGLADGFPGMAGPREILVNPEDLERARSLIATD